jgi:hypothetical protein
MTHYTVFGSLNKEKQPFINVPQGISTLNGYSLGNIALDLENNMLVKHVTNKLIDIFLNGNTFPTGFEASQWLRLQKRGDNWVQIGGVRLPSWQFKKIVGEIK